MLGMPARVRHVEHASEGVYLSYSLSDATLAGTTQHNTPLVVNTSEGRT